jgi:hypothetical protein
MEWTFVGTMANGERIYFAKGNGLAIEKDNTCLVAPSPAELQEIQETKSHLRRIVQETVPESCV